MKKLIVTLILGLITVVSFSSCGNSKKDAENLIIGEWILVGDNMGHHLMDGDSEHLIFNADGTWNTVYILGGDTITYKGKYYIVNKNTIATAFNGKQQEVSHFEIIGKNQLQVIKTLPLFVRENGQVEQLRIFFKRANN